jgi:hypothetical protein
MKKILIVFGIFFSCNVGLLYAQPQCVSGDIQLSVNANGDITCQSKNNSNFSYVVPSQSTLDAEAKAQSVQDAINNKPENKFNKDLFDGQLGQTKLVNNPTLLTFVGALDRFIDFKNFQAIANVVASMFQGGELSQDEVDIFVSTVKNQGVDLTTYNSLLIDNSVNAT